MNHHHTRMTTMEGEVSTHDLQVTSSWRRLRNGATSRECEGSQGRQTVNYVPWDFGTNNHCAGVGQQQSGTLTCRS
jgi:hypothetical protein